MNNNLKDQIKKLQKEIEHLKKIVDEKDKVIVEKDRVIDNLWPATAKARKLFTDFCKAHNIKPTEQETKKVIKVAEHLELMLKKYVPSYRYGENKKPRIKKNENDLFSLQNLVENPKAF